MLALVPRVLNVNAYITWDEPMWAYRSIKFLTALRRMDFGETYLVGHPGVITMWCGATGISIQRLLGYGAAADFAWLSGLPTLDPRDTEALRKLASRGAQVVVTTLVIAGITHLCGVGWQSSLTVGMALALSSTAIALKVIEEQRLAGMEAGQSGFAVLLFQDIAVIPMLAMLPLLAGNGGGDWLNALKTLASMAALLVGGVGVGVWRVLSRR